MFKKSQNKARHVRRGPALLPKQKQEQEQEQEKEQEQ